MSSESDNNQGQQSSPRIPDGSQVRLPPDAGLAIDEPHYLHPSSLFFEVFSQIRQYIWPALFGAFGLASGNPFGMGVAGVVLGLSFLVSTIRYFTLRYRIKGDDFIVTEGLLFRRVRSVPVRRIQNVDLIQNVLHRLCSVAVVNIETASGTKPEATLRVLTLAQIEELRESIFGSQRESEVVSARHSIKPPPLVDGVATGTGDESAGQHTQIAKSSVANRNLLLEIPTKYLVLAGLASNRGLVILGVIAGFIFQGENFQFQSWRTFSQQFAKYIPNQLRGDSDFSLVVGVLLLFVLLKIVSAVWYVLRFHGYQLTRLNNDLRVTCGLFTKVSATIPRGRIQFISVHRPILLRPFGLASIRIETAGGSGKEGEDAAATVSRRWFVPVLPDSEVVRLLAELRPGLDWQQDEVHWFGVSKNTGKRLLRLVLLISAAISAFGLLYSLAWGWVFGVAAFVFLFAVAKKKAKSRRYARLPWGVAYQSGLLTRRMSFSFYDRMQTVDCQQSPFDRRWKMASLRIDTAAAGPADHLMQIDYLDEAFAHEQFGQLQTELVAHRPDWN